MLGMQELKSGTCELRSPVISAARIDIMFDDDANSVYESIRPIGRAHTIPIKYEWAAGFGVVIDQCRVSNTESQAPNQTNWLTSRTSDRFVKFTRAHLSPPLSRK